MEVRISETGLLPTQEMTERPKGLGVVAQGEIEERRQNQSPALASYLLHFLLAYATFPKIAGCFAPVAAGRFAGRP